MARKQRAQGLEEDEPGLDISSLIDICFLLLIYFIVTSTIKAKEQDLDMALPSQGESQPSEIPPIFISINAQNVVMVGAGSAAETLDSDFGSRELPLLEQRLSQYIDSTTAVEAKPIVQMHVEGEAKQQRVVDVLNLLSKYGVEHVTFTDLIE